MIISISGSPGSGKSTAAKRVAEQLGMKFYSMGDLRGERALARGLTINEFNNLPEDTDTDVDQYVKKLGQGQDNFVIDSRLAWHFIPQSFKIFIKVDPRVGAERVMQGTRKDEPTHGSVDDTMRALAEREQGDQKRYKRLYEVDHLDLSHYDLVIDSSHTGKETVVSQILDALPSPRV